MICVLTVAGDVLNRVEIFDETDLDAALARFDDLHPQERRLENTATRVSHCYAEAFASRNWNAVSEQLADDFSIDDRRRTVNGGSAVAAKPRSRICKRLPVSVLWRQRGWSSPPGGTGFTLTQARFSGGDDEPFENELLNVIEVDADERMMAVVVFESDDFDAAISGNSMRVTPWERLHRMQPHGHSSQRPTRRSTPANLRLSQPTTPSSTIDYKQRSRRVSSTNTCMPRGI